LVNSQAVVSAGLVYWGSWDGYERATNPSGGLVWQTYLGRTAATCDSNWTVGVASTAAVVNSVVYVGGGDGQLYALNAATGSVLWQTPLGEPNSYAYSAPAVFGGSVYIGVAESPPDCPFVQGRLVQVNEATGVVQNSMKIVPDGCTGGGVWGSPTVDEAAGTLYFATGPQFGPCSASTPYTEAIIEVRASGLGVVAKWQLPAAQSIGDSDFGSTPTLFTRTIKGKTIQAMVGIANKNGVYYAFKRDHLTAGPIWQVQIATGGPCPECGQGSIAPSAWDGRTLYAAGGNTTINGVNCAGSLAALNPSTGGILWKRCLADGPVLGAVTAAPGIVAVAEGNKVLVISAASGQTLFAYTTLAAIYGSPSIADGVLYVGDNSGTLYAFNAAGPTTSVLTPSNGAFLAGSQSLDATASDNVGVTNVKFLLTGGTLNHALIATATLTYYGWLTSWDTTTVPDGTFTLQSAANDAAGNTGLSPGVIVNVNNTNTPPNTSVLDPSDGASLAGSQGLAASASSDFGVTKVEFHLTGGTLNDALIATGTLTYYGWLTSWDTTTVLDGTYTLQSVAYDAGGDVGRSTAITVTVNNPPPSSSVLTPANGASLTGNQTLDASVSGNVTNVEFLLTGGTLNQAPIATATLTYYGWLTSWDTTTVPDGTYSLQSAANDAAGNTGLSPGVTVNVNNTSSP
jgi:outer membrane protein assembly factor BamB